MCATYKCTFYHAAAVPVEITRTINIELDLGETSFFEYQVPEEGMTVTLLRQQGSASLFASNKVQNPNSAFYDYRIDGEGEVFVDLQELLGDREKRDLESDDDDDDGAKRISSVLFVSVEGIGNTTNSFQIRTSTGNTGEVVVANVHSNMSFPGSQIEFNLSVYDLT